MCVCVSVISRSNGFVRNQLRHFQRVDSMGVLLLTISTTFSGLVFIAVAAAAASDDSVVEATSSSM